MGVFANRGHQPPGDRSGRFAKTVFLREAVDFDAPTAVVPCDAVRDHQSMTINACPVLWFAEQVLRSHGKNLADYSITHVLRVVFWTLLRNKFGEQVKVLTRRLLN